MNKPNSFDVLEIDGVTHYLPHEGYYRRAIARENNAAVLKELAHVILAAYLRVRETLIEKGADPEPDVLLKEEADAKGMETEPLEIGIK